jgi:hypothetical protein
LYDPMRDAWIKHNRALTHIQALTAACGAFVRSKPKPYDIPVKFEMDTGCHVARFVELRAPDVQLGATVGDIAHNLRSALDITAWQLAIQNDREAAHANQRSITFPLARNRDAFHAHKALPYFSEPAQTTIERLQPYDRPDRQNLEALAWLSALSNADKHRVATGCSIALDLDSVTYQAENRRRCVVEDLTQPGVPIESGTPIARLTINGPPQTKVRVEGEPTLQIQFASSLGRFSSVTVATMFSVVGYALTELASVFR